MMGRTNLIDWPAEYCPCVDPLRQMIDCAGMMHGVCMKPIAPAEIEARKFDREAGPRRKGKR